MAPPRQVVRQQLEILLDFLEENKDLLKRTTAGSPVAQQHIRQQWTGISKKLNAVGSGALKAPEKWKKYWYEWRYKCRKKAADAKRFQSGTNRYVPLNDLEIRVIELSGKGTTTDTESSKLESFLDQDSDSEPLENMKSQMIPAVKKAQQKPATSTSRAQDHLHISDKPQSTTPPPKWALDIEERRIAAEERMATALESIASVMQSQEERRAIMDERISNAVTSIAGTVQDLNNSMQEALQHLHQMNPVQTNGPNFKANFIL